MQTAFEKIAHFNRLIGNANASDLAGLLAQFHCIKEEFEELRNTLSELQKLEEQPYLTDEAPAWQIAHDAAKQQLRDDIADILVTTYGLAHRAGINADADLELVYASNMSKFIQGTENDALAAGVEIYARTGLKWCDAETAPGIWAITSSKDQTGKDGKFYPEGKLLKPATYKEPDFSAPVSETDYLMQGENGKRLLNGIEQHKAGQATERCTLPPSDMFCTRTPGHDGPCATYYKHEHDERGFQPK